MVWIEATTPFLVCGQIEGGRSGQLASGFWREESVIDRGVVGGAERDGRMTRCSREKTGGIRMRMMKGREEGRKEGRKEGKR